MCGIAGCIVNKPLDRSTLEKTLLIMKNRGPDFSNYLEFNFANNYVYLLHSRLSIIDLDHRSNQPFKIANYSIIFNGEIYNYVELKTILKNKGYKFKTSSDTEVLLQAYIEFGDEVEKYLEGMWAFAIWDNEHKQLYLSRDRFGEKPLYYKKSNNEFYFASEIKFINSLSKNKSNFNYNTIKRYLVYGYRSIYKNHDTYYEDINYLESSHSMKVGDDLKLSVQRYWKLKNSHIDVSYEEAVEGAKYYLLRSLEKRLRADVPLAFNLSGGIDSSTLVTLSKKYFDIKINSYSIIDDDPRYNESKNINKTINLVDSNHTNISLKNKFSYEKLKKLVHYHDQPLCTINFFAHALLQEKIHDDGFKVSISGTGADEIFSGYYDHHLYFLYSIKENSKYSHYLNSWEKNVKKIINNPLLKDPQIFEKKGDLYRDYLYEDAPFLLSMLKDRNYREEFTDIIYNKSSILRNRMMNELFNEVVPILMENEDLNSMFSSVENRSPFLDTDLLNYVNSVPQEFLMHDGFAKIILRDVTKGLLDDDVRLDRNKRGFNASIESFLDMKNPNTRDHLLEESPIFDIINKNKFSEYINSTDFYLNKNKKFLFYFLNIKIFLENKL